MTVHSRRGQSITEVLISIAIAGIFAAGAASIIAPALRENSQAGKIQQAATEAQSLLAGVRVWSEANWSNVLSLATGTASDYYLITSSTPYTATSGVESIVIGTTTYTRYFYLTDAYRASGGAISNASSGNTYDPSTKQITVVYGWAGSATGTMSAYLTRNGDVTFLQTDWSGGPNPGRVATTVGSQFSSSSNIDYTDISGSISIPLNSITDQYGTWVLVPGNSTFGTPNFWVMKYAAVCTNGSGSVVNTPSDDGGYDDASKNCTSANSLQIGSFPGGDPIVDVSHTSASSYCQSIGAHLLTNDEYMTIVTNAANQGSNWTGGSVGSGGIYIGNANNPEPYPAGSSDANGYAGESDLTVTYTNDERRTFTLSNGSIVWDMSGNVWEDVSRSVNDSGDATTTMSMPSCSDNYNGWEDCQFGNSTIPYITSYTSDLTQLMLAPPNSSWNSSQNVGVVQTYGSGGNQGAAGFARGGNADDGSSAGAFAFFPVDPSGSGNWLGFRCSR
ncbi:MAG TPA: SUMF1/EgtB/PvdO family nonheme iron enzyme [Candidatus Paceibacterota bacterium]|nr:SUMF1/EgtB/PvdO family nonheme iron enzyme [Candidatus Paceibacterota bacterium]